MTQEFDARKSYLAVKASEKMVAYVGFAIAREKDGKTKEGVVKISSFQRAYGGGYLTLTFIVDKGKDERLLKLLEPLFAKLTEDTLKPLLGKEFERMVRVDMDSLEDVKSWYVEEINVYFQAIKGQEKALVEAKIIPALEKILPCQFDAVEWYARHHGAVKSRPRDQRDYPAPVDQMVRQTVSV